MEENKKFSFSDLITNNRALAVISLLLAVIVWLAIAINESPETTRVVEKVKVTIDDSVPSQLGYEMFSDDEIYVDVTVKGKRYMVGDNVLSANDIKVVAVTNQVTSPGQYTLQLKATAKDSNAQFEILSKSQDVVDAYFDTPKTEEFEVAKELKCEANRVAASSDYKVGETILSTEKIEISGPATEIDKIRRVTAVAETKGELKETEILNVNLVVEDAYGNELKYLTYGTNPEDITLTVPIYKIVELPVKVDLVDFPKNEKVTVKYEPTKIKVAVDTTKLNSVKEIVIGEVKWSSINKRRKNRFTFRVKNVSEAQVINDSELYKVTVTVD